MEPPAHILDDLDLTLAEAWARLAQGTADRRSAFHTPQVATIGLDGAPRLRTVVLRAVDVEARSLRFHTDKRSPKVAEIAAEPRVAVHLYDPLAKLQIRLDAVAVVETAGARADAAWAGSRSMSRVCYRVERAPGDPIDAPSEGVPPTEILDPDPGRENFAVVVCAVTRLEWLHLAHGGHRRAAYRWGAEGLSKGWLVP